MPKLHKSMIISKGFPTLAYCQSALDLDKDDFDFPLHIFKDKSIYYYYGYQYHDSISGAIGDTEFPFSLLKSHMSEIARVFSKVFGVYLTVKTVVGYLGHTYYTLSPKYSSCYKGEENEVL